MEMALYLPD